jgi:uncharacterized membrane protein YgcG
MRAPRLMLVAASALALSVTGANAQSVISAHSGVLHYYEGDLTLDGQAPHQKPGTFAEVKENQDLQTQVGRAEVLLTPGVFLRVGENTGIRMLSNKLTDTRVEFLKGSAIVDFVEVAKDNQVTLSYQDYKVTFVKKGIYRFDSEPAELKVYTGEAIVSRGTSTVNLKDGKAVPFTPALVSEKFDNRTGDALYRWAKRRSEYIAVANLSAARKAGTSFNSGASGWYYNPYYSMFTFIPGRGYLCDPFATFMSLYPSYGCYYSPLSAYNYFARPAYGYGGGGYSNPVASHNSSGYYPTSIGTSSTLSTYSGNATYSPGPSVSPSSSSGSYSGSSSPGFSGGSAAGGGGFSGGGGGAAHGGGSAGGHGK